MKKLIIILLIPFISCIYVPQPQPPIHTYGIYFQNPPQRNCSCGYVIDKGVDQWDNYFLDVQNQCSGYVKRFTFQKSDWINYSISDGICLPRNSSW